MQELDTLLQEKIEALEAGGSLETCLVELPEQEAKVLRLVAAMRQMQFPEEDREGLSAQRAQILTYAQQTLNGHPKPNGAAGLVMSPSPLDPIRSFLDRLLSRREFAWGALTLLILFTCSFLFVAAASFAGWMFNRDTRVADAPRIATPINEFVDKQPTAITPVPEPEATASPTAIPHYVSVILPASSAVPEIDPKTVGVQVLQGIAEIQTGGDGAWQPVNQVGKLAAGQWIRTGPLSSVVLTFFDGSEAHLGENTVIIVDELDAPAEGNGPRIIKLTQKLGESEHFVEPRNEQGARYKITTPGGIGIAKGTQFSVLVTEDLLTQFSVAEGEVEVTNLNDTIVVKPGQFTMSIAGQTPSVPTFQISGEGEVTQTGLTWIIAGQSFQTNEHTIIVGNPQVGDLVRVEGYLTSDGKNVAFRIILLRPALTNHFALTGQVEDMGGTPWIISGQEIVVNDETSIEGGIQVGDTVYVSGIIRADGTLVARQIILLDENHGQPFFFAGLVQEMHENYWVISGKAISIDGNTTIEAGIEIGDLVSVRGRILEDNVWLARSITPSSSEAAFEFTGIVQTMEPWTVSGIPFETRDWTVIDPGIEVGDRVRVAGVILSDGRWVAAHITSLETNPTHVLVFIGIVNSMDPWVVNGLPLVITDTTVIGGQIRVGTPVVVTVQLMEDGTWVVLRIQPLHPIFGFGCLLVNSTVTSITGNQIILSNWTPIVLGDGVVVEGDIQPNSVILFQTCVLHDGTIIIIHIIVIYRPVIIIIPDPPKGNHNGR